jgi:hypothetical protein
MKNKLTRTRTWELERYLLGELPPRRMEEIKRLAQENPDIRKEIERLSSSNPELLQQHPPEIMIPEILERYEKNKLQAGIKEKTRPLTLRRLLYAGPVLATALVLLFIVFFQNGTTLNHARIKGEELIDFTKTQIIIYRKKNSEIDLLKNGYSARAGDLLQIAYVPAGKTNGVIFSTDGNGTVTLHFPEGKNGSTDLKQEKKVLLASSYELDDAPGFERFFFITAEKEIDVEDIIKKAEALAASPASAKTANLELPESYHQFSILLEKEKSND